MSWLRSPEIYPGYWIEAFPRFVIAYPTKRIFRAWHAGCHSVHMANSVAHEDLVHLAKRKRESQATHGEVRQFSRPDWLAQRALMGIFSLSSLPFNRLATAPAQPSTILSSLAAWMLIPSFWNKAIRSYNRPNSADQWSVTISYTNM